MAKTGNTKRAMSEANVLLTLAMEDPMSFEVLDRNSDDVLDAVQRHAADVALGATISLDMDDFSIRLRFDVKAASEAAAYRKVAKVLDVIEKHTDLDFTRSSSAVEASDGELVSA